jgi:hypothetical protein
MLEPNDPILQACPLGAKLVSSGSPPASIRGSSSIEPSFFDSFSNQRAPLSLLPDVFVLVFFLISPSQISLSLPGVINDFNYFLTPIVTGMYRSNSFMDGSAIGSFLPILRVSATALKAVSQCRKFQAFIPAVPEECAPPMCKLLFACVLLQFYPARFFLGPVSLLLVPPLLVAFFL